MTSRSRAFSPAAVVAAVLAGALLAPAPAGAQLIQPQIMEGRDPAEPAAGPPPTPFQPRPADNGAPEGTAAETPAVAPDATRPEPAFTMPLEGTGSRAATAQPPASSGDVPMRPPRRARLGNEVLRVATPDEATPAAPAGQMTAGSAYARAAEAAEARVEGTPPADPRTGAPSDAETEAVISGLADYVESPTDPHGSAGESGASQVAPTQVAPTQVAPTQVAPSQVTPPPAAPDPAPEQAAPGTPRAPDSFEVEALPPLAGTSGGSGETTAQGNNRGPATPSAAMAALTGSEGVGRQGTAQQQPIPQQQSIPQQAARPAPAPAPGRSPGGLTGDDLVPGDLRPAPDLPGVEAPQELESRELGGVLDSLMEPETVVARVNDEEITWRSVKQSAQALPPEYQDRLESVFPKLLKRQIDMKLLAQTAREQGLQEDAEIQEKVRAFEDALLREALLRKFLEPQLTDEVLRSAYESLQEEAGDGLQVKARHILLPSRAEAEAVIRELREGADFKLLARERSLGSSAQRGGDLGTVEVARMVPAFAEALATQPVGQFSAVPVQTDFGWHVILVEERLGTRKPRYEEVAPQLRRAVSRRAIDALLEELRDQADIEITNIGGAGEGAAGAALSNEAGTR